MFSFIKKCLRHEMMSSLWRLSLDDDTHDETYNDFIGDVREKMEGKNSRRFPSKGSRVIHSRNEYHRIIYGRQLEHYVSLEYQRSALNNSEVDNESESA